MKKAGSIFCLSILIVIMAVSVCYGSSSLEIVKSYPKQGQKNTTIENMGIKLWFNSDMGSKESVQANEGCFQIIDNKGKKLPVKVFYSPKDNKEVMVLVDATKHVKIRDNTKYTLKVSGSLQDNTGDKLGTDKSISFTTLNQKTNTRIYMFMMMAMFGGMFLFSSKQMKKQAAKQANEAGGKREPFNPYKEAKKQGKSVSEVIAQHEKEMAKKAAKAAKEARRNAGSEGEKGPSDEKRHNGNYRVKYPRPISAAGSTYITGRKAQAEARRAEEERLAKRREAYAKKKKKR